MFDKVTTKFILDELNRVARKIKDYKANRAEGESSHPITGTKLYMAEFNMYKYQDGQDAKRLPYRIYPAINVMSMDNLADLLDYELQWMGTHNIFGEDTEGRLSGGKHTSIGLGIYINANYINETLKTGAEEARDLIYEPTIYTLANDNMIEGMREYVSHVFMELYETVPALNDAVNTLIKGKNITTRDIECTHSNPFAWNNLRYGVVESEFSAPVLMTVLLGYMYSWYVGNEEYLNRTIKTNFNYTQKFNSFMATLNFFMNKINRSENFQIVRDLLEIDDKVFFSVMSKACATPGLNQEKKIDLRYGANIMSLMGHHSKNGVMATETRNRDDHSDDLQFTSAKKCLAESFMMDTKSHSRLLAAAFNPANRDATINYFSEFMNISINRTQAEKLTEFSRKIDQTRLLYESMVNQWNKEDAINAAYAVLRDIDDECAAATDKNYLIALDDLRKQLTDEIIKGRNIDVQKRRMTINVNYPKGYEG